MNLRDASGILNLDHIYLTAYIGILFTYFLLPTFVILIIVGIIREKRINKKLSKQKDKCIKLSDKQQKINTYFKSDNKLSEMLGDIEEPKNKNIFSTLDLKFDTNGKVIRKEENK